MNIIDYIPFGKDNAISRTSLVVKTGLSDRKIRDLISKTRRDYPILNLQNGKGYYLPTNQDKEELEHYIKQETARAKSIFWSLRGAKKAIRECVNG